MDESPLPLSTTARTRRVGRRGSSSKSQTALPTSEHITCVATISIQDAPVPPLIIFPGVHLQQEWIATGLPEPHINATVTRKGWNNAYKMKEWLERCFDPYTRDRAHGSRRLLFLDGPSFHLGVDFLEACWARDIDLLVFPPHLTSQFQPLDRNFFATLKLRYNQRVDEFQLGFTRTSAAKGMCYRWLQEAWSQTANSRQIRAAWKDAGIWPLNIDQMDARPVTPPPQMPTTHAETPQTVRMMKSLERQVERGEITAAQAWEKAQKGFEKEVAEKESARFALQRYEASEQLDKVARNGGRRTRIQGGEWFDRKYREEHAQELAARGLHEGEARRTRREQTQATSLPGPSNFAESSTQGASRTYSEREVVAFMHGL